jgi:phytoene dehydrogenase-like protein
MSDVVIVGAGLAGLCCAVRLQEAGVRYTLVEAADAVGGRVRTDAERGFIFDRGFQMLLSSYPEAARVLDYSGLDLHYFEAGAKVYRDGDFITLMDPWRHPTMLWQTLTADCGTWVDRLRMWRLRRRVNLRDFTAVLAQPETTAREALERDGFSPDMLATFFQPFLRGVLLEPDLATSSRKFHWAMRMFTKGRAALPAAGMGAIPAQLVARLPKGRVMLNTRVKRIEPGCVSLEDGRDLLAAQVVVATDAITTAKLIDGLPAPEFHGATNVYYSMKEPPVRGPILLLNGDERGPVAHMAFVSEVSPLYAPKGQALASVSLLGVPDLNDRTLDDAVRQQLVDWFGMRVADWKLERIYRIPLAVPAQPAGSLNEVRRASRVHNWLTVAGDWRNIASINGAMESGRLAAESVLDRVLD